MKNYKVYDKKTVAISIAVLLIVMLAVGGGLGAVVYFGLNSSQSDGLHSEVIYQTNALAPMSASDDGSRSIADVVDLIADTVVEINVTSTATDVFGQTTQSASAGSGVVITETGYIVTNHHVVDGAEEIKVIMRDGTKYAARLVGKDAKTDIAVIKIDSSEKFKYATFGDSSTLRVGQTVVAIGNPLGQLGGSVTDGIISALDRKISVEGQIMTLMQTNAAINPGNSGGGLFDLNGSLIGVVNAKSTGDDVEGLGFAIPADIAKEISGILIQNGYVPGRIDLGLKFQEASSALGKGLYVSAVNGNNAAQFKVNDFVKSVDGKTVTTLLEFENYLDTKSVGDAITFVISRKSGYTASEYTFTVTLLEDLPE